MMHPHVRTLLALLAVCVAPLACVDPALAQPAQTQPAPADATTPTTTPPAPSRELPPALKLGDRVAGVQQRARTVTTLVIVSDPASYLEAIAGWTSTRRYPVLIDDGTPQAAEDIARFARAFRPSAVVRFGPSVTDAGKPDWTAQEPALRSALARAWDQPETSTNADLITHWRSLRIPPPGVVVVNPSDPAWTAGIALAAARAQVLLLRDMSKGVDTNFAPVQADQLQEFIEQQLRALALNFDKQGDEIEAVTIAAGVPARIDAGNGQFLATTDRIGRSGAGVEQTDRWAWCGQVFGSAPQAAYRAMCSVFLDAASAWLFDGYPDEDPWKQYDMTKAGDILRAAGIPSEVIDTPDTSLAAWRRRAAQPVDAGLIFVNTKGNADFFDLSPGQGNPADVPILARPAGMQIVHSWSATQPGNRDLLAGRWLERGVFFYFGSVHEPFLSAFIPPASVAQRLSLGAPWAAAMRHDTGPVWKLTVLGDPLMIRGSASLRSGDAVPLANTRELSAGLRDLLREARFEEAFRALLMGGRDADLVRLVPALLREKQDALTPGAAELLILPLFREQAHEDLFKVYALLDAPRASRPDLRDALWLAARPRLARPTPEVISLLRANLRQDTFGSDAIFVAAMLRKTPAGDEAANTFLAQLREATTDQRLLDELNDFTRRPMSGWGQ